MRIILLTLLFVCPLFSYSQHLALSASFVYDHHNGDLWRNDRGLQLGIGLENTLIGASSYTVAFRYFGTFTKSAFSERIENIAFEMPDEHPDAMGFGKVDFKKMRVGMELDFGYQDWEDVVLEPYVSMGLQLEHYGTWIKYDLYQEDTCHCFTSTPELISKTTSIGYKPGIGIKVRPFDAFAIDFRASYYGGWTINTKKSSPLPNTNSVHIDDFGAPTMDISPKWYNHGFTFRIGLIFNLQNGTGGYYPSSNDYDSDDSDDDDDDDYSSPSDSDGRKCDPIELTPSGRGGGG
jgi:hypothetical protein